MKKRYWIPLLIVAILIAVRLYMPYWITDYVNDSLDDIPGYSGSIAGVDLNLLQGSYAVDSLAVAKTNGDDVPFLAIDRIGFSVDWGSLLRGAVVGEVALESPVVSFAAETFETEPQMGDEVDWAEAVRDMMPVRINRFTIRDGTIRYLDRGAEPAIDLTMDELDLEILNISNIEDAGQELPTSISLSAVSVGGGELDIQADADLLKDIPDVDLTLEFEGVNLPDLNDFLQAYAGIDAEKGNFFLYSEFVIDGGNIEGYLQPVITDLQVLDPDDEDQGALSLVWEGIVEGVTELFKNHPEDQFATRVPISGDLNNTEVGIFPTIWNIFRNAFVEAFEMSAGGEIEFGIDDEES
ncbi:MAG: DUF748 domain-containing protein [Balneolaceae bacterium]